MLLIYQVVDIMVHHVLYNKMHALHILVLQMMHVNQLKLKLEIYVGFQLVFHNNVLLEYAILQLIMQMKLIVPYFYQLVDIMEQYVLIKCPHVQPILHLHN